MVIARLQTSGVICMEEFDKFPSMARFNLRDEGTGIGVCNVTVNNLFHFFTTKGKTIAIGKVLKILE